ncbi:MAG: P-loop NTPase [Lentisphaeraceae bacterium]|nr:P-loop NTPase [Lentisphaeraceae bacterium]
MTQEEQVLDKLSVIIDPDLGQDIVSLGFIKDLKIGGGAVAFSIELTTPACPVKEEFRKQADSLVRELSWVESVDVNMTAQPVGPKSNKSMKGLAGVKNVIGVYSCKGGVGKSTVAVNLAYSLARTGAKVGIFDADVYGPSLPSMVNVEDTSIYQQDGLLVPLEYKDVKLMSFGFVNQEQEAAILRGPMVTQVISQLLGGVGWGDLDYLIIDFPPGTGDIQLTLLQTIELNASVIVTTPQNLSFIDVTKGIQMFETLNVPTVACVENMSYYICGNCDEKHRLFGSGALRKLKEMYGFKHSFEIPVMTGLSEMGDTGVPLVLEDPSGLAAKIYSDLTSSVVREVSRLKFTNKALPKVEHTPGKGISFTEGEDVSYIAPNVLRGECRCAVCVEEFTGEQLLDKSSVPDNIQPTSIAPMGNYAVSVQWSDGHTSSVYPYEVLRKLTADS